MGRWHYSRAEKIADGVVHAVGIVLAAIAGAMLLAYAASRSYPGEYIAAVFYVVSLLTVLSVSLAYNLWPVSSPAKWVLRRVDHSAIYLLIAATYTPFLAQIEGSPLARLMIVTVWAAAAMGIALKIFLPGRFDRLAVLFYLAIGWSGVILAEPLAQALPANSVRLIIAGGIVYSLGVVFFVWKRLRFHTALWHGFVVTGAGLHLAALADCLVLNRL
ncbi:MAG TPA: hemolysin III family protein [Mesorhizobium sp.]|jgi:hemolysin III